MDALILALETSCDETSAAVVRGTTILSNVVSSQAALHAKWGGVVPEAAARAHVEAILPVISEALTGASRSLAEVDAIAVTNRPGLVGALSVGVTAAKALAFSLDKPLLGIHHLEGHLMSPLATDPSLPFPHLCLIVSGGHTELVRVDGWGQTTILGQTIDDAAGEAFDKSARLLGLGYPGGFAIQEAAKTGDPARYKLPKGLSGDTLNFSFSGLKTAVLRLVEKEAENLSIPDAAASVQEAIASVLAERAVRAAEAFGAEVLTLAGGVAANARLRELLNRESNQAGIRLVTPPVDLCTDNAAMIGLAAAVRFGRGERDDLSLEALPNAPLP
ncbi:MAG: tRNA (adenosine(37)-N6)-threonylcarbamoyltransferase complex transferase subunit TsaD [Fimbriimonadales bacterium]